MFFFNASNEKRTKYLSYCEQNGYTSKSSDVLSMDKTVFKSQRLVYCTGIIFFNCRGRSKEINHTLKANTFKSIKQQKKIKQELIN